MYLKHFYTDCGFARSYIRLGASYCSEIMFAGGCLCACFFVTLRWYSSYCFWLVYKAWMFYIKRVEFLWFYRSAVNHVKYSVDLYRSRVSYNWFKSCFQLLCRHQQYSAFHVHSLLLCCSCDVFSLCSAMPWLCRRLFTHCVYIFQNWLISCYCIVCCYPCWFVCVFQIFCLLSFLPVYVLKRVWLKPSHWTGFLASSI